MDRHGEEDRLAHMVALLLSLATMAAAAQSLPAARRSALLAVLHQAAGVAFAFAARVHAPLVAIPLSHPQFCDMPASGPDAAARLAMTFYALACALAVPARQAMRAGLWLRHDAVDRFGEASPPAMPESPPSRPGFPDTS